MSGANGRGIPTRDHPLKVELEHGGHLLVRAGRYGDMVNIMSDVQPDQCGASAFRAELYTCMWGIVDAVDAVDAVTRERVEFKTERRKWMGDVAAFEFVNRVLSPKDRRAVMSAVNGADVLDEIAGKPDGSPSGSTASAAS
jgi:hypothetical protein